MVQKSWPGVTIAGVVIVVAAILADYFGDPPKGGTRLVVGLVIGLVAIGLGYVLRSRESPREDKDAEE